LLKSPGKVIAALVGLGLGAAALGIYLALRPPESPRHSNSGSGGVVATSVGRTVAALGRLEPEGRLLKISAPSTLGTARVVQLLVREGAMVKAGQVIAVMDTRDRLLATALEAEARVQEAQVQVNQARTGAKQADVMAQDSVIQARLEQVRSREAQVAAAQAEVARRNAEFENAKSEYARYEKLAKEGAISESELDQRKLIAQTALSSLEQAARLRDQAVRNQEQAVREFQQAQAQKASLESVRPIDVQKAEAALQVALANFEKAKADLETAAVRSPIDGKVIKIHAYPGEQVGENGIAEIGRTSQMYAVAEVYETDIGRVKLGQRAKVSSPAFDGEIEGVVAQIGQKIDKNDVLNTDPAADTDIRVVEVKVRLENSQKVEGLTNLQVRVEIDPDAPLQPLPQPSPAPATTPSGQGLVPELRSPLQDSPKLERPSSLTPDR